MVGRYREKPPTKAEKKRFGLFPIIGCVACYMEHNYNASYDVHHLLSGGRRIGHRFTVPLCPWHHRAVRPDSCRTDNEALEVLGPSLAKSPRMFLDRYGDNERLLSVTDRVIGHIGVASASSAKG